MGHATKKDFIQQYGDDVAHAINSGAPDDGWEGIDRDNRMAIMMEMRRHEKGGDHEALHDLLSQMLNANPRRRPTATEVLAHPWTRGVCLTHQVCFMFDYYITFTIQLCAGNIRRRNTRESFVQVGICPVSRPNSADAS